MGNPVPTASPRRRHLALLLGLWAVLLLAVVAFRSALGPAVGAFFIAYVVAPLVDRLAALEVRGHRLPRWAAVIVLYLGFFAAVALFVFTALPQLYRELVRMTVEVRDFVATLTPERLGGFVGSAEVWLERHGIPLDLGGTSGEGRGPRLTIDLQDSLREALAGTSAWLSRHLLDLVGYSRRLLTGLVDGLFLFFFVLMVAAFLLVDVRKVLGWGRSLAPEGWGAGYDELVLRMDQRLSGAVRGQLVICVVNGVLTLAGLLLLEVKFALLLALVATVLTFIPIFGSILSSIPIVVVALSQSWRTAVLALAWILAIHALEAYFLNPKILGRAAKIHPAVIALVILAGERSFGFVGALFAVPATSIFLALFDAVHARADALRPAIRAGRDGGGDPMGQPPP